MVCELPKVYRETQVRARKEHTCCECQKRILAGESYVVASGVWDRPRTYKTCLRCNKVRELAARKYSEFVREDELPGFGELFAWLRETIRQR